MRTTARLIFALGLLAAAWGPLTSARAASQAAGRAPDQFAASERGASPAADDSLFGHVSTGLGGD